MQHHALDIRGMRSMVEAVLEDRFGTGPFNAAQIAWLETDEGRNHRHILSIWDEAESDEYFDEVAARSPALMQTYLDEARIMYPHEDETKAKAANDYAFDLFCDVVEILKNEA